MGNKFEKALNGDGYKGGDTIDLPPSFQPEVHDEENGEEKGMRTKIVKFAAGALAVMALVAGLGSYEARANKEVDVDNKIYPALQTQMTWRTMEHCDAQAREQTRDLYDDIWDDGAADAKYQEVFDDCMAQSNK